MRYLIIYFLFVFFQCDIVGQSQRRLINYNVLDVFAGSNIQDDVSYFLNQKQNNYLHLSVDEKVGNKKNTFFLFRWDKLISHQDRSEEHTSELQSRPHLVCRLLLEKKKKIKKKQ